MDADRIADRLVGGDSARPSSAIADFIKAWEKCVLRPYLDVGGRRTVGWGHLMQASDPDEPVSQDEADALFDGDLRYTAEGVARLIYMPLAQRQFDALCAFAYNVGLGNLAGSTLRKRINGGYFDEAGDEFLRWNIAGGEVNAGLAKRRAAERAIFLDGDYSGRP